jgi:predicted amidohydrolase
MRALLTALRCEKADVEGNAARHRDLLRTAREHACDLAVFPEMSLTGSLTEATGWDAALRFDSPAVTALAAATGGGPAAVFGFSERLGAHLSITHVVAAGGAIVAVQRKRHLGEGEEPYHQAGRGAAVPAEPRVGVAICAEADVDHAFDDAATAGAEVLCFCAAPGLYGRRTTDAEWADGFDWWRGHCLDRLPVHARRTGRWILVSTQAGATADEDFPGWAAAFDPTGAVASELPDWREGWIVVDVPAPC